MFILDPWFAPKVGALRYNFLLRSLEQLDRDLQSMGSELLILEGSPRDALEPVLRSGTVATLAWEIDTGILFLSV